MADRLTAQQRSENMRAIKSKGGRAERLVCSYLFKEGFRFRKNDRRYIGTPDIVLPKYRLIIFVHGCFWHAHQGCRFSVLPKTNTEFWHKKRVENRRRDERVIATLLQEGWRVLVIWECELATRARRERTLSGLVSEIYNC